MNFYNSYDDDDKLGKNDDRKISLYNKKFDLKLSEKM